MRLIVFFFLYHFLMAALFGYLEDMPKMIWSVFVANLLWTLIVRKLED